MGDQNPAVRGPFHGAEDAGAGRGAGEADVEEAFEGAAGFAVDVGGFGEGVFTAGFFDPGKVVVEVEFLEGAASDEEAGGVGGGPVGQAVFDAVGAEFMGVGGAEDFAVDVVNFEFFGCRSGKGMQKGYVLASNLRGHDLADDVTIGEADDETVFWCIVFVLRLGDETLAGIVVGFALSTTLVFGLVAAGLWSAWALYVG